MKSITLGLLALFAVAASSGAFADCPGHVVKTTTPTTVATTDSSTPVAVPSSGDGG
jgi:hypothetical protein